MIESKRPLFVVNISLWLEMVIAEYAFFGDRTNMGNLYTLLSFLL